MTENNTVTSIYPARSEAEAAVKALQRAGFDMQKWPIVGKDYHTEEHVIHQRLTALLQAQGVVPYTSTGQPFDPRLHEAVDVIKTAQATSGVVLDELSHGYRWGDEVLRPARVRVAQ
jgi:molecular chaperone GrpE (heat shock protein)